MSLVSQSGRDRAAALGPRPNSGHVAQFVGSAQAAICGNVGWARTEADSGGRSRWRPTLEAKPPVASETRRVPWRTFPTKREAPHSASGDPHLRCASIAATRCDSPPNAAPGAAASTNVERASWLARIVGYFSED